jgi:hypothetical protein
MAGWMPYVLRTAEGDTSDAGNVLQSKLSNGLASLLLVAGVDGDGSSSRNGRLLASLNVRVGAVSSILNSGLGDILIGKLFYPRVRHLVLLGREYYS